MSLSASRMLTMAFFWAETRPPITSWSRKYIRNRKIHTVQWAMGEPCYLLTRPNCRHYLIPVATKYALSHSLGDIRKLVQPRKTGVRRPLTDHDRWIAFVDLRAAVLSDLRNELVKVSGWKAGIK